MPTATKKKEKVELKKFVLIYGTHYEPEYDADGNRVPENKENPSGPCKVIKHYFKDPETNLVTSPHNLQKQFGREKFERYHEGSGDPRVSALQRLDVDGLKQYCADKDIDCDGLKEPGQIIDRILGKDVDFQEDED